MQKSLFLFLFTLLLIPTFTSAQIIWTEPALPTAEDAVTVFFNATEGNAGLAGCNCDVYVHTGVITNLSTSATDWKHVPTTWGIANDDWKMTPVPGSPDVYSFDINPSIIAFYNVPANEIVEELAFVFRNADGSLQGKEVGDADIFYPVVQPGFFASFLVPQAAIVGRFLGETIDVEGVASEMATLSLYDNGSLLTQTSGMEINFTIDVQVDGEHLVELVADNGTEVITTSFTYVTIKKEAPPAGVEPGITYLGNGSVILMLVAPQKESVFVIGDFNDWNTSTDYVMNQTPLGDAWWIQIDDLTDGEIYGFQYLVDGDLRVAEPYSETVLDEQNDPFIPEVTYPNLPAYPSGKTSGTVSLLEPGQTPFDWQVENFERPEKTNLVIYELLLRDFLHRHDFQTLLDTLDYLDRLGVTAVELMPVNEYSGNISWGYNPSFHHALDKYYGSKDAFKLFIDACHERGIAVILDVVFNHSHEDNPLCRLYWNEAAFRPADDNPWLNPEPTHDFNVFFDFNHDSPLTKDYVVRVLDYWLNEYKIDGFRFDLSKGLTQNENGPWHAGNYDASRIATIKHYADAVWNTSPGAYMILEHFAENSEEIELTTYGEGMMTWSGYDVHNQYLEASMGYNSNLSGVSYKSRGWDVPHLITYMESHDEERMMYKNLQWGNSSGDYSVKNWSTALRRVELASVFFYPVPGPKMIWQFGELGYDFSINHCPNGTINDNCRTDPKPITWGYRDVPNRYRVYQVVSALNQLKKNYDVFQTTDFDLNVHNYRKSIHLNGTDMNVAIFGNFNLQAEDMQMQFQHTGWWYNYFTGDSLNVTSNTINKTFSPGEYRFYTDVKLTDDGIFSSIEALSTSSIEWNLSPNPTTNTTTLEYELSDRAEVQIDLYHISGQHLQKLEQTTKATGIYQLSLNETLSSGTYLVQLKIGNQISTKRLVVIQ